MMTRMTDIAVRLGVSVPQVSRALSNRPGVAEELRSTILAAARVGDYRNRSGRHHRLVAVVSRKLPTHFLMLLWKQKAKLGTHGFHSRFLQSDALELLRECVFDAVIAVDMDDETEKTLLEYYSGPVLALN